MKLAAAMTALCCFQIINLVIKLQMLAQNA